MDHLCNAIVMCGQPQQLMQVLQQTLPAQVFSTLLERLPLARNRMARAMGDMEGQMMMGGPSGDAASSMFVDAELE